MFFFLIIQYKFYLSFFVNLHDSVYFCFVDTLLRILVAKLTP